MALFRRIGHPVHNPLKRFGRKEGSPLKQGLARGWGIVILGEPAVDVANGDLEKGWLGRDSLSDRPMVLQPKLVEPGMGPRLGRRRLRGRAVRRGGFAHFGRVTHGFLVLDFRF